MNISPDHPDFTALALGEHIHGTPAQAVIEALRTSVAARNEADQIRTTGNQLAFALKGQPPLRLDTTRRNAIFNADVAAVRARFAEEDRLALADEPAPVVQRPQRTWIYPTLAAAAVAAAAILVMKFLPSPAAPAQPTKAPLTQTNDEPNDRVMVKSSATPNPSREQAPPPAPAPALVDQEVKPTLPDKGQDLHVTREAPPPIVQEKPPVVPKIPAPHLPSTNSPPPEAVDPSAPKRKPDSGNIASPKRGK